MLSILIILTFLTSSLAIQNEYFLGCYKDIGAATVNTIQEIGTPEQCVDTCHRKYYRYSYVRNEGSCICSNYLGDQKDTGTCRDYCANGCESQSALADVYRTGVLVNGPPRNLQIHSVTETSAHLQWDEPESFLSIQNYKVEANYIFTYSTTKLRSLSWMYPNNTFQTELISLHPGSHINITVQAVSAYEEGVPVFRDFNTQIGEPSQKPADPEIVNRIDRMMQIRIKPVFNDNGPVSSYLVIVINAESVQAVQTENLKAYRQANAEGYSYYITAELQPQRANDIFTIGDGIAYGKYYNAPLEKDGNYHVMIGVVSKVGDLEKIVYSETVSAHDYIVVRQMNSEGTADSPVIVIILSIGIVVMSLLLIAGLIGFYFLRNHVHHRHRQRLNDNQELTLQGPMIDVENHGYISEDESSSNTNHYKSLNEQVWVIPRNILTIEHTVLLGIGEYGRVHTGTVAKDNSVIPVGVYSIADRKLQPEAKRAMLKDLDVLIKTKKHPNVLELIGTCESMDTICIVLELTNTNLKELLLKSRVFTGNQFTNLSKSQAIDFAIDVAKGMEYLHSKRVIHKQLCSAHVAVVNGSLAKITGFGLAKYYKTENTPDLVRYTAREVFRGQQHITKSDVWSFACVLWEICVLGGTLYGNISSNDLPEKIMRGLNLAQLPYISDSLYQIILNCWQIDLDERPTFSELIVALSHLSYEQCIDFSMYEGFQYEPYYLELEMSKQILY